MKVACVLDACAMIAFLRGEEGADAVTSLLLNEDCMAHAVNFAKSITIAFCVGIMSPLPASLLPI